MRGPEPAARTSEETWIGEAAADLDAARRRGEPLPPVAERYPGLSTQDAYRIQQAGLALRTQAGAVPRGHKVGLTSAAMRRQFGVTEPDYGVLLDEMLLFDGTAVPINTLISPRVEPEIAFVLAEDLAGPGVTVAHARAAVSHVVPALEIIDSRVRDWQISLADTIADNASSALVILGAEPLPLGNRQLRTAGCVLWRGGEVVTTGAGGSVMGNPVTALAWLANTLGGWGQSLRAGEIVLPGACTMAVPATDGDVFSAVFAGLGSVTARFTGTEANR